MTTFPGSPKLVKGALIGLDPFNPLASVIVFQYNPAELTRTLKAKTTGEDADRGEAFRIKGAPDEDIALKVDIDAADQLETGDALAGQMGVYPTLAALEMLLYPKSARVIANEVLALVGIIEVIPPEAPLTLFVWGVKRILPVRLTNFSVTETQYDPNLNPIQAEVTLGLHVLTYQDLGLASVGGALFMAHQIIKEVMATVGSAGNVGALGATIGI
jgi:hypothetical protein